MTVLETLAAFVTKADAAALPAAEQAAQRRHLLDTVVAAAAAARSGEGRALATLFRARALPEIIGQRAATIRLSEIDDIHLPSCTTPSAAAVATALSLAAEAAAAGPVAAQHGGCDPGRVASAVWAGTELMTRLGEAVRGPDILYRGIWPSYLAAPLAVAATAARMRELDPRQTTDALSLALMLSAGGVGRMHGSPSARWVLFALAVAAGISAVDAAQAGYGGDPALLDGNWFQDTHGCALDRDHLAALSAEHSVYAALSLKPFCSAKQAIAAVEALRIVLESGVRPDAITALRVRVPPAYVQMISQKAQAGSRSSTLVSVARQLALRAYDPSRLLDVDRSETIVDPAILGFEAKVEVVADPDLAQYYPRRWPAELEVMASGAIMRERVVEAPGDPGRPLGDDEIAAKAHGVLDRLIGRDAAVALIEVGRHGLDDAAACGRLASSFERCFSHRH
jgi:2-methylcitrate dehydratase PrpD